MASEDCPSSAVLLDAVEAYVIVVDEEGRVVRANEALEQTAGLALDSVLGRPAWDVLIATEDAAALKSGVAAWLSGDSPAAVETRLMTKGGGCRRVSWSGVMLPDGGQAGRRLLCTGIDVTDLRETQEILQERTDELNERIKELNCLYEISSLVERIDAPLAEILQGIVDLIPPAWQYPEVTCARIDLDGQSVQTANFAETAWRQTCRIVVNGKPVGELEVCYLAARPDRDEGPFLKEERSLIDVIAERVEEVIERKESAEALKTSEELHRMTLSNISDAVFITDDDGAFTYVCPNVHVLFGYSQNEVTAFRNIAVLLGKGLFDLEALVGTGEIPNIERTVADKQGVRHDLLVNVKRVSIHGGSVLYTCHDVTELNRAEEKLRQQQAELAHVSRLSTMGEMASGIAHELNQPLSAIVNYSKGCARRLTAGSGDPQELERVMHQVAAEAERAGEIIRRLRDFVQKKAALRTDVNVNDMIHEAVALVAAEARYNDVEVCFELAPALPNVAVDVVQVQQVIVNLVRNALEAMNDVGPEARRLTIRTSSPSHGSVEIAVQDSGHGIPPEVMDSVFDPFFSTKSQGMGIGLSISRSIVEAHGGRLRLEPNPDRGVTCRFELPLAGSEPDGRSDDGGS